MSFDVPPTTAFKMAARDGSSVQITMTSEEEPSTASPEEPQAVKPRRRIIRRRRKANEDKPPVVETAVLDAVLAESALPKAYNFEILKTLEKIDSTGATHVALQMPEGLLLYATVLADIFKRCIPRLRQVSVLGDVTYGACCVDDLGAKALGASLLIHYGHSCLVPIQHSVIPCLYVFVELVIDVSHFVECICKSIPSIATSISLLGTIQFRQGLVEAKRILLEDKNYTTVVIPQAKPLSPGEVLGCTSPKVTTDVVVFCADGRFHLESTMISNPQVQQFLRYDPYSKSMTQESYAHEQLNSLRLSAIETAKKGTTFGIVLGTLGRQGNPAILQRIKNLLKLHNRKSFILLLSEISPAKLSLFHGIDAWVQVACPRLSVDWGHCFPNSIPILSPYELFVCLDDSTTFQKPYPMDFYANHGGPWSNYYESNKDRQCCGNGSEKCGGKN